MTEKKRDKKDAIDTIIRKKNKKETGQVNRERKARKFRPIIIASVLAIVTGSVLGFVMLNMFTSMDENQVATTNNQISAGTVDENEDQKQSNSEEVSNKSSALDSWSAFVVQGGVFSEESNAKELATTFEESGYASVIWEKDNQYFILVGISDTEEGAERVAEEMSIAGHEVFVKDWENANKSIDLTEEEQKWIESFASEWKNTLQTINDDESFPQQNWDTLLENKLESNQALNSLSQQIAKTLSEHDEENSIGDHQLLLEMWLLYEELM